MKNISVILKFMFWAAVIIVAICAGPVGTAIFYGGCAIKDKRKKGVEL